MTALLSVANAFLFFHGLVEPSSAATIRVPLDQPTIQQAIIVANDGDLVLVSPGIYFENVNFDGKGITLQSTDGPAKTVIDGEGKDPAVAFHLHEGPDSVLAGFTIQHGKADLGAVDLDLASPTIIRNTFRDNGPAAAQGAAIDGNSSSPVIEGNVFFGNTCDTQDISAVVGFDNFSSPYIVNNIFVRNPCRAIVIGLPEGNVPVIANNTIVQNRVGIHIDARVPTSTQLYANNILVANEVGLEVALLAPGREPTWTHNLVFMNGTNYSGIKNQTGLNGNISSDPLFLPTGSRQTFQLDRLSPVIDAGLLILGLPPTDFLGNPRVVDGNGDGLALPDIGAYEFVPDIPGLFERSPTLNR